MALPGKELPWIVDGDGHVREPDRLYDEFLPSRYRHLRPRTEVDGTRSRYVVGDVKGGWKTTRIQPRNTGSAHKAPIPVMRGEWDPLARLEDMHLDGISHAVLFPTQGMAFGCVADRDAATALSRAYNDWLGEYCSADPEHLRHIAHVPFGHIPDAVAELERAKEAYDSVGVYLRPNPYPPYEGGGKFASDPGNEPFWEAAEELGVAVCFHEAALLVVPTPGLDRFGPEEYYLIHAGAHPIGQMMAMLETMGMGVLDRHPRLRVGFLEAGCGWVPGWLHRFDEHVEDWAGGERLSRLPSEQFRAQGFVSAEGDEVGLELFVSMYPENVVFASDYPHADCTFPGAPDSLLEAPSLDDRQKRAILMENPARWFGLSLPVGVG
jgi:uncharacterized protein